MGKFTFVLLMLIVAILFSVFSYSIGAAFQERPDRYDFCQNEMRKAYPPTTDNCPFIEEPSCPYPNELITEYDDKGCPTSYTCSTCGEEFQQADDSYKLFIFMTMSIIGIFAIIAGLVYPHKQVVIEWIANGFLLGGLINLFVGTVVYFGNAPNIARPIILFIELIIVIYVAVKKLKK